MGGKSGGRPPRAPDYTALAHQQGQLNTDAARLGATLNRVNQVGPDGSVTFSNQGDQWTQTTQLSPEQQKLRDQSLGTQGRLGGIAADRLGSFGDMGGFSMDGMPSRVSSLAQPNFQGSVDLSGLANLPTDVQAERQRAEDAVYSRATQHLDPQFQQTEDATRTRLMNQGLREGSEAWNTELANLDRSKQAAYGDARDRAITAGGAEASRLLSDALATRGQGAAERFGQGEFANRATGMGFGAAMDAGNFQNQARDSTMNERLTERSLPLQEFLSLYGGGYQAPQLGAPIGSAQTPQAADVMGAAQAQYGADVDRYNARQAQGSGFWGGLTGLASAAMPFVPGWGASDERLKENIQPIGTTPLGEGSVGLYDFNYKGDPKPQRGVMAQEVEQVQPDAVATMPSGFKAVDYGQVLAGALGKARARGAPGRTSPVLRFGH